MHIWAALIELNELEEKRHEAERRRVGGVWVECGVGNGQDTLYTCMKLSKNKYKHILNSIKKLKPVYTCLFHHLFNEVFEHRGLFSCPEGRFWSVCPACCQATPKPELFINNRNLLPTVPEATESKVRLPAASLSDEGLLLSLCVNNSALCQAWW